MEAWFESRGLDLRPDLERYAEKYNGFYIERQLVLDSPEFGEIYDYTIQPPLGQAKEEQAALRELEYLGFKRLALSNLY